MLSVRLICVGRVKEDFFLRALDEYKKRLSAFCSFEIIELPEERLPADPGKREIELALEKEGKAVLRAVPGDAFFAALCIEGKELSSPELAELISRRALEGKSRLCFAVGGSFGLSPEVKARADIRLSMSRMTFPHHLARVMLTEQVYRAFTIIAGRKYHK